MATSMDDKVNAVLVTLLSMNNNTINNYNTISSTSECTSSESEDEEDEMFELEILYTIFIVNKTRGKMIVNKQLNYVARVIPGYSKTIFKEHFR